MITFRARRVALLVALAATLAAAAAAEGKEAAAPDTQAKAPTRQTLAANKAFAAGLDLAEQRDFADATRGFIASLADPVIKSDKGETVWDQSRFAFIEGDAPASVNPSLWRQERLNNAHGLFKVAAGIYQIRSYDVANMTLIAGNTGWIVIDTLLTAEAAKAALALADQHLGKKPIQAVIYTHSHADHFGGVRAIVDEAEVKAGKIRIIAPDGFMEHAVAENVLAGNAMTRRAQYQFGTPLEWNERGAVGVGLGKALSVGAIGLIAPTETISRTGQELIVDGVRMMFQMANGSEAPSEFMLYLPEMKALCLSEVVTANMHNVYTLRGAKMRDALGWSKYINEALDLFPDAEVAFRSHHWPVWGKDTIRKHLAHHRDAYRFVHDEALRLANSGQTMDEIGNAGFYPKELYKDLSTHGYYGTLSHNLRAVYNFYLGYYDGNPASLNRLPPQDRAKRYIAAMGGARAVLVKSRKAFAAGDYRWVAEIANHLVFADPKNAAARALQADALEQLGYQAESGVWRNEYLTGAQELRKGVQNTRGSTSGPDLVRAMPLDMIFDFVAVRLNHPKVDGLNFGTNIVFSDTNETYALELSNSVLNNTRGRVLKNPDATLTLTHSALFKMLLAKVPLSELVKTGEAKLKGDPKALGAVFSNLDNFDPRFNIVTP
jgi:alkyl sulfatase BDS1-like metallo-beta-lactamase superfamily hydrolase